METLLTLAVVVIVALIVIAMDQAAQLEVERALHKADRNLWKGKEALLWTAAEIADTTLNQWEKWADEGLRKNENLIKENENLRFEIANLENALKDQFVEEFYHHDQWGPQIPVGPDGQESYDADEFGFCLSCGVNHEQEDAEDLAAGFPTDADYKRTEDVVINNAF